MWTSSQLHNLSTPHPHNLTTSYKPTRLRYERKSKSTAYIPDSWGKWKKTLRTGEHIIMVSLPPAEGRIMNNI